MYVGVVDYTAGMEISIIIEAYVDTLCLVQASMIPVVICVCVSTLVITIYWQRCYVIAAFVVVDILPELGQSFNFIGRLRAGNIFDF
jgi:hypothetical protein